jgi:hypothetical protein
MSRPARKGYPNRLAGTERAGKVRQLPNGRYGVVVDRGPDRSSVIIAQFDTRAEAVAARPKLGRTT